MENHKYRSWIKEANLFTGGPALMKTKIREADFIGLLLDIIGIVFVVFGFVDTIKI